MSNAAQTPTKLNALATLKARRQQAQVGPAAASSTSSNQEPAQTQTADDDQPAGPGPSSAAQARKTVRAWAWICGSCNNECVPIRTESRCLCGHRMKEHEKPHDVTGAVCKCKSARCACPNFFFVVAEGSWVLHCRCKHKHTDHDPVTRVCKKPGCKSCTGFDSPWVCNCDHPWAAHKQVMVEREFKSLEDMMAAALAVPDVNRHDLIARGLDAPDA